MILHHDGISRPLESARLRVLNLGAGVQSSTLLMMAERGEIPERPDVAMFSDTQWEPARVYDWLEYLRSQTTIPIERVSAGSLREKVVGGGSSMIPAFVNKSPINRGCTRDFKITPIQRRIRERLGLMGKRAPRSPIVEQWFGISTDEIQRVKFARDPWIVNRYPLIEARMSRRDCVQWMAERQYRDPPWSSCIGCPFHGAPEWREIRADPAAWADAVEVDRSLRDPAIKRIQTKAPMFLHRQGVPLDQANLEVDDDPNGFLGFANECDGLCGT